MSTITLPVHCLALPVGLLLGLLPGGLPAATLHVAPDGNDAWSGKPERPNAAGTDGPLATLAGARDAVRRLKAQGPLKEAVHVSVAAGTYPLTETLVFEPQDSGTSQAPIVYQAAGARGPSLPAGGRSAGLRRPTADSGRFICPRSQAGKWYFEDLYVNGRRATCARSPNEFYYYVRDKAGPVVNPATGKKSCCPSGRSADPKDIALLTALPKERLNDAMVVTYLPGRTPFHGWPRSIRRPARSC